MNARAVEALARAEATLRAPREEVSPWLSPALQVEQRPSEPAASGNVPQFKLYADSWFVTKANFEGTISALRDGLADGIRRRESRLVGNMQTIIDELRDRITALEEAATKP